MEMSFKEFDEFEKVKWSLFYKYFFEQKQY